MSRFAALVSRFRKDERGVFLVIFAVIGIVLIATSGAVVDFSKVQQSRTRAQLALDAAALALQGKIATRTEEDLKADAQALLTERIADSTVTAVVEMADIDLPNGTLTLHAYIEVPTFFVQLVGVSSMRTSLLSAVTRASSDLEVSLAIDITGSMKTVYDEDDPTIVVSDKIGDLINASNMLIDLLVSANQVPTYSKMAIVPWSGGVNVGSYATTVRGGVTAGSKNISGASWATGNAVTISSITKGRNNTVINKNSHGFAVGDYVYIKDVGGLTRNGNSCINGNDYRITDKTTNSYTIALRTDNCTNATANSGNAQKCTLSTCEITVTATAHGKNNNDRVFIDSVVGTTAINNNGYLVASKTNDTFVLAGTYGPTAGTYVSGGKIYCGDYNCHGRVFTSAAGSLRGLPLTTCVAERATNAYTDDPPTTTLFSKVYGLASQCPTATIQPLTSNRDTLHAIIGSYEEPRTLVATGSTAGHIGLAWGWYMLSPKFGDLWPDSRPAAYKKDNLIKAVIFMTDGQFNTPYMSGVIASNAPSGSGSASDHINIAATTSSKDQASAICTAIKHADNATLLYVVGFDLAGDANKAMRDYLEGCATSKSHFFRADDGTDLELAFQSIAQSLSELRLSK